MFRLFFRGWLLLVTLALFGCGSDSSSDGGSGAIQLINGIENSPGLFAEIDEDDDLIESVTTLGFKQASPLLTLTRDTYEINVFYTDPETEFDERLLSSELDLRRNTIYLGILSGTFESPTLTWVEKPEGNVTDAESEDVEFQAINLSSDSLSFYVGDDSAGLASGSLVATIAAGVASDPIEVEHDDDADYRARLTLDGSASIIYDSGDIQIQEATRRLFVAVDNTGPDPDTKSLFIVSDGTFEAPANDRARSGFRVINSVADAGDALIRVKVPSTGEILQETVLMFGDTSPLVTVDASFVDVEVEAPVGAATQTNATVSLDEDTAFTIVAGGSAFDDDISIRANPLDVRSVATSINLHFVNTLRDTDDEDSSAVDFYALRLGEALSDTAPVATAVDFLEGGSFVLPAADYDFVVTTTGTQSILAGPARLFPIGGEVLSVVSAEAAGGGLPNQVLVITE